MHKPLARITWSLLISISAFICAQRSDAQVDKPLAGTTITVALRSLPETDLITSKIQDFEKSTGIKVQVVTFPEQQLRDKLVQDLSTKAGQFTVIAIDSLVIPEFSQADWILPLDNFAQKEGAKYDLTDISAGARGLLSAQGKLYALPIYAEVTQLMYRKDLFEQAAVKPPTTIDQLVQVAKKFTNKAAGKYGIAMRGLRGFGMNMYIFSGFLRSYGGQFLTEKNEPNFNTPEGTKALEIYSDILKEFGPPGEANFSWDDVQNAFTTGSVAMILDANNFYTRIEDPKKSGIVGKIGYASVPSGPHGQFPACYSLGFAVSAIGAKSNEEQQAAAEFIFWATSYDIQMASVPNGLVSQTRDKVLNSLEYKARANPEWLSSTAESWKIANPDYLPRTVAYRTTGDILGVSVQEAIAGSKSPKDALAEASAQVADYLKRARLTGTPRSYTEP